MSTLSHSGGNDPAERPGNRPTESPESDEIEAAGTNGAGVQPVPYGYIEVLDLIAGDNPQYRTILEWWLTEIDRHHGVLTERGFYRLGDVAESTLRSYRSGWADYRDWCLLTRRDPFQAETVTSYLSHLVGLVDDDGNAISYSTLEARTAAIGFAHAAVTDTSSVATQHPLVREALSFWSRQLGTAPDRQAKPLTSKLLRRVIDHLPPTVAGARDRALLTLGVAAALRRSELSALELADIEIVDEGLVVTIRTSKADQHSEGELVGIPYGSNPTSCPVRAHHEWLRRRGTAPGPLFGHIRRGDHLQHPIRGISGNAINDIVKRTTRNAGLPAGYTGHSFRAGFVTSAAEAQLPNWAIMQHARYRSTTVMTGYIRRGNLFNENPAAHIGL